SAGNGVTILPLSLAANESVFLEFRRGASDPVISVSCNDEPVWPHEKSSVAPVAAADDSFIVASWVQLIGPEIPLPSEKDGRLVHESALDLPGPSFCTVTSPGQGGAGFIVGANGIVVFRYERDGSVAPLLVHEMSIDGPVHVGVLYEGRIPRLFVNGVLVKT